MNRLFPVFLKLENLNTLIVGGGNVGSEKLEAIIGNSPNAKVKLVAPLIRPEIEQLALIHSNINLVGRNFEWDDLDQIDILICATDDKKLHKTIFQIAKRRGILVNVADTPDLCDFYLSSVVKKGELKIAISTNGKSPTFAKRMKEYLNEVLDSDDINELLRNLTEFRSKLKGDFGVKVKELNKITQGLAP
jgi:siroheme synthase-like protein